MLKQYKQRKKTRKIRRSGADETLTTRHASPPQSLQLTPSNILYLQRTIGNQSVLQLLQRDSLQRADGDADAYGTHILDDNGRPDADQQGDAQDSPAPPAIEALAQIGEDYDNKELKQYETKPLKPGHYETETTSSTDLTKRVFRGLADRTNYIMNNLLGGVRNLGMEEAKRQYNEKMVADPDLDTGVSFQEYINLVNKSRLEKIKFIYTRFMGWDESDTEKYLDADGNLLGTAVTYEGEDTRKQFEVTGGSTLMQNGEAFDTKDTFSKFMGKGFAIYVMDSDGTIYASQHKVGFFHHSSFLAGASVAAAGEMKVSGGKLEYITNKSGHYEPKREHLVQVLKELDSRGVNLDDVDITELSQGWASKAPIAGRAKQYLERHG